MDLDAAEGGEEVGEEGLEEGVFRPVRGIEDFGDGRLERGELRADDLPPAGEGLDGERGGEEEREEVGDLVEALRRC